MNKDKIILGIDPGTRIMGYGLLQVKGKEVKMLAMGVIDMQGPATELYVRLQAEYPEITFTVSGGIASIHDIRTLRSLGLRRIIVGKAIYEGRITLSELC